MNTRSRGFHWEEQQLFEEFAQASYKSFVAKAAASRNMSYDSMHAVAQGRAWTGRQAFDRGLVDILGGFWKALEVAAKLSEYYPTKTPTNMVAPIRIHTFSDYKMDLAAQFIGWQQTKNCPSRLAKDSLALAMCPDEVSWTGLAAPESLGISPVMQKLGVSPTLAHWLRQELPAEVAEPFLSALSTAEGSKRVGLGGMLQGFLSSLAKWLL
ncbi:hypothetical protein EON65_01890 [archaeon]|nr:MAG: hypothetical protein EON65_01890 [archaeon]